MWKISYLRAPISDEAQQVSGLFQIFFWGAVSSDAAPIKLIYAVPSVNFWGAQIMVNEMGRSCDMCGGEKRCIRSFGGETRGKETTWKTQTYME
jgi:hypothetical protein